MLLIENVQLIGVAGATGKRGWLLIDGDKIAQMGSGDAPALESAQRVDGGGGSLLPGFIDVHVHGSMNADTMDATPDALTTMARFFASRGVSGFLATTMTQSDAAISKALANAAACQGPVENGATILGVHLEGPYINLKAKGAQEGTFVRPADPTEYQRWLDYGVIKLTTVAPEIPENVRFIQDCVRNGVVASIGHTTATYDQAITAFQQGVSHATHTFNAMTGLHHRAPGTVGALMTTDSVYSEIIADNVHVHLAAVHALIRAKGVDRIILITDAIRAAGIGDGETELGGQTVYVKNGTATLADGTLAGSVLTMDQGVRNVLRTTGLSLEQASPMFSYNAARQIGLGQRKGKLQIGYDADLVLLDADHNVQTTIALGRVIYQR
ncbi:MAG: N-acetylglucosamine-6-phosphate deacetylase [Anaerolineae bacterium]|nr:N-acetylglucosamine-6-phosphate deacetylase [Anaerolineae bacterium]